MKISEEQLKKLALRALKELAAEAAGTSAQLQPQKKKLYMLCSTTWTQQYLDFLQAMESVGGFDVYPVIPSSWEKLGTEAVLKRYSVCKEILHRSCEVPADLADAVTVLPLVSRDVLAKTALCIGDTFENSWIAAGIERSSRTIFLRSGLTKFTGKEPSAYVNQIMGYCRRVLEYGIEIGEVDTLTEVQFPVTKGVVPENKKPAGFVPVTSTGIPGQKRVITAANVEHFADGGVLYRQPGDIVTDLAKDRAKFLNIKIR